MAGNPERHSDPAPQASPAVTEAVQAPTRDGSPPPAGSPAPPVHPPVARPPSNRLRNVLLLLGVVMGLAVAAWFLVPWVSTALNTVSTDDAYVNSHVTFVAPRVAGQVTKVLVDDNY